MSTDKTKKNKKNKKQTAVQKQAAGNIKNNNILTRFFSHNITLLILSFILAFTIWFVINVNSETDSSVTISDIPITIELSEAAKQDGLDYFRYDDTTAKVEVSGNRVTVGSLSASDITVSASDTSTIITSGRYTLPLTAKKSGIKTNYQIVSSVDPATVTFYVDKRKESEFPIVNRVEPQYDNPENRYYVTSVLSHNSVVLSGPAVQVNKIAKVVVSDDLSIDPAKVETKTVQETLKYLDAEDKELDLDLVTAEFDTVEATVTVLPKISVKLTVDPVGQPSDCPTIKFDPVMISVAGPQSALDTIEDNTISLGELDFSELTNTKITLTRDITLPSGCISVNGVDTAAVSVDLSKYSMTSVNCTVTPTVDTSKYLLSNYSLEFNETIPVTVYGPESVLSSLTSSKISAVMDLTEYLKDLASNKSKTVTAPITVKLKGTDVSDCWVYGDFTVSVSITKK